MSSDGKNTLGLQPGKLKMWITNQWTSYIYRKCGSLNHGHLIYRECESLTNGHLIYKECESLTNGHLIYREWESCSKAPEPEALLGCNWKLTSCKQIILILTSTVKVKCWVLSYHKIS